MTTPVDLAALAALVGEPDPAAYEATLARPQAAALGRLAELAAWIAARQGTSPPSDFARARLIAFTGLPAAAATAGQNADVPGHPAAVSAVAELPADPATDISAEPAARSAAAQLPADAPTGGRNADVPGLPAATSAFAELPTDAATPGRNAEVPTRAAAVYGSAELPVGQNADVTARRTARSAFAGLPAEAATAGAGADLTGAAHLPAAVSALAEQAGVTTGVVALDTRDAAAALAAGIAAADAEVDAGADLLIAGDLPGPALGTAAAAVIAALADVEPVPVIGRGTGLGDRDWTAELVAVRDALRRGRRLAGDPVALLAAVGTPALAALTGFLAQAAVRRTAVVLDGAVSAAAALTAREFAPRAVSWWLAGHRSTEPAQRLVLERLQLTPVLDLDLRRGGGTGALLAVPILRAAIRAVHT